MADDRPFTPLKPFVRLARGGHARSGCPADTLRADPKYEALLRRLALTL
ncbi:MAG: hypothetical protein J2P52_04945 [Blastocatellia bacterium]|nr:hypothetical protein [Blastocatellia bacterium]